MLRWNSRRRLVVVTAVAVALVTGGVAIAYVRRIAPPWPAVAGTPYEILLGSDGCPVIEAGHGFVDTPGPLVPPGATEVVLCTTPNALHAPHPEAADPPRQQTLHNGVAEFVARLNGLPDRNTDFRQHQRRYSGWWPDAPPLQDCFQEFDFDNSFVLFYPDRPPVPLIVTCYGPTSGARTRIDSTQPHVVDEFLRLLQQQ